MKIIMTTVSLSICNLVFVACCHITWQIWSLQYKVVKYKKLTLKSCCAMTSTYHSKQVLHSELMLTVHKISTIMCTITLSHTCTITLSHTCTITLSHTCTITLSHTCTITLSHTCTITLSHTRTITLSHTCTITLWQWPNTQSSGLLHNCIDLNFLVRILHIIHTQNYQ